MKWSIPPTESVIEANRRGAELAAQLIRFLRDNRPQCGGNVLSVIVRSMALPDPMDLSNGYAAGFLAEIERRLVCCA